jgi:hypothetical protein
MKIKLPLLTAAILTAMLFFLSSSSPAQKVDYYSAAGTSFAQYKTYKWQRADKALYPEKVLDEMFIRTINGELARKGLSQTENDDPDLIVTYQIAIMDDMEWSAGHSNIPWQGMVGAPGLQGGPVGGSNAIKKGSFILDFYDVKQKRQVWQAHATKTLANTTDFRKREKNTQKAMAKIFKNYPPHAK